MPRLQSTHFQVANVDIQLEAGGVGKHEVDRLAVSCRRIRSGLLLLFIAHANQSALKQHLDVGVGFCPQRFVLVGFDPLRSDLVRTVGLQLICTGC